MRRLFPILLVLLAALRINSQSSTPPDPQQSRILALENAWNQAVQQKDGAALEMLLAPELTYIEYDGTLMTKSEYLTSVQVPTLHPVRIVSEAMNIRLHDGVALVTGVYRENGVKEGKPYAFRERFTDTWVRRGGSWMCAASQSTLMSR